MADGIDRLSALDLLWLEMEGDGPPIAIGTVAVASGRAPSNAELRALMTDRMARMPELHKLVVRDDATGLRRPVLTDSGADLDRHLHRLRTDSGLDDAVARIMERHLPADRPLWDAWIVTGWARGKWALVWRVHHSLVDGLGALSLIGHGFDTEPDGGASLAEAILEAQSRASAERHARPSPGPDRGNAESLGVQVGGALGRVFDGVRSALPHVAPAVAAAVPQLPSALTGAVGDRRVWVSREVPLADVKAVGRAYGATVNDVVLASVTGGFRALLVHRGEPTRGRTVRNMVPVSMRPPGDGQPGNHVSALLGHLPVGVADPVERLHRVAAGVEHGRGSFGPTLVSLMLGAADRVVPAAVQDVAMSTAGATVATWFFDTLTTNVPGPQFPVYLMGRRLAGMYPIIPVAGHTAITTGIFSFDGKLDIGVTGDGELASDVRVLAEGIAVSVAELVELAG